MKVLDSALSSLHWPSAKEDSGLKSLRDCRRQCVTTMRLSGLRCVGRFSSNVLPPRAGSQPRWPDMRRATPCRQASTQRHRPCFRPGICAPVASGCVFQDVESKATPSCRTFSSARPLAQSNRWPRCLRGGRLSPGQINNGHPTPVANGEPARAGRLIFVAQSTDTGLSAGIKPGATRDICLRFNLRQSMPGVL